MSLPVDWNEQTMLEIKLHKSDDFLKIRETLTRIGVLSKEGNRLFQSCHILHKNRGQYFIVHFKEMFALDKKVHTFTDTDLARRNAIAFLLQEWGLLDVVDKAKLDPRAQLSEIKVIPFKEKGNYELVSKYTLGKKSKSI